MDESSIDFHLVENGFCNYCNDFLQKQSLASFNSSNRKNLFNSLIKEIQNPKKNTIA